MFDVLPQQRRRERSYGGAASAAPNEAKSCGFSWADAVWRVSSVASLQVCLKGRGFSRAVEVQTTKRL